MLVFGNMIFKKFQVLLTVFQEFVSFLQLHIIWFLEWVDSDTPKYSCRALLFTSHSVKMAVMIWLYSLLCFHCLHILSHVFVLILLCFLATWRNLRFAPSKNTWPQPKESHWPQWILVKVKQAEHHQEQKQNLNLN